MAQLVVTLFLFFLLFAPLDADPRGRRGSLFSGRRRTKLPFRSSREYSTGITNQNSGRAGLQARLRWSKDVQYVLELRIGSPAHHALLGVDTSDNFIWNDCLQSSMQDTVQPYYPDSSYTYGTTPCNSQQWENTLQLSNCDRVPQCRYNCSWAAGILANETFRFEGDPRTLSFGCNDAVPFNYTDSTGYAGIGGGPLSLISQLSFSKFSYCFTDAYNNSISSYMFFGSFADLDDNVNVKDVSTTRLINDSSFYYYLDLEGISVNSNRLAIPPATLKYVENSSGTIIYTSDPLTYLVQEAYDIVKEEVKSLTDLPLYEQQDNGASDFVFDLCFNLTANWTRFDLSNVTFHLAGANMSLPLENLFLAYDDGEGTTALCLMIVPIDGAYSYLGSFLQQNLQFIYDLKNEKLSFRSIKCDQLPAHKSVGIKFDLPDTTLWGLFFLYILLL